MKNLYITLATLALVQLSQAQKVKVDTLKVQEIEDILLHKHGNPNKAKLLSTKSNLTVMETPQPIAIVTHEIIEQQQARQLSEVVQNVNGLYVTSARGGAQDSFGGRGFLFGSDNMFKNGARVNSGIFPEVQGLERVEVLKGGNAMQFGASAPGAIINMVTKKPRFDFGGSLGTNVGSWNTVKPFIDIYGPLSKKVAFRMNGAYEYADSFRDVVNSKKHYFNPSFLFNFGENTQLIIEGDYLGHRSTPDFGLGSIIRPDQSYYINDKVSDNTFFGTPWQYQNVQQATAGATLNTRLAPNWYLTAVGSYQNYTRDYFSSERIQWQENAQTKKTTWARPLGRSYSENNYTSFQINVNGEFLIGKVKNKMLIGADGDYTKNDSYSYSILDAVNKKPITSFGTLVLEDPTTWTVNQPEPITNKIRKTTSPMYRGGVLIQDLISITDHLKVLAGVRYNYLENRLVRTWDYTKNTDDEKTGIANIYRVLSPKFALIYEVDSDFSLYGNYTNSFAPNTGFTSSAAAIATLDLTKSPNEVGQQINNLPLDAIKPSQIDQYEIGIKKNFLMGALAVNLSAYQITNKDNYQSFWYLDKNGAIQTPANGVNFRTYAGTVRSRGVELDITGNPTPYLSLIGGFSYNNAVYTDTPADGFIEGQRLVRTPATTANASVFYNFGKMMKGFKVGLTGYYIADRLAGWNDTKSSLISRKDVTRVMQLDDYFTLAFSAGFDMKKFSIQGKISNLTNTKAYIVHENYSVNPLAPRNFYVTLTYKL